MIFSAQIYPPDGTKYASNDPHHETQNEILEHCANTDFLILFWDINSLTGIVPDFTVLDEFISKVQGDKTLLDENIDILSTLQRCNIPLERHSADLTTNTFGIQLIKFCKSNDLFVLNGRIGEECIAPKPTYKDPSTVGYLLSAYVI